MALVRDDASETEREEKDERTSTRFLPEHYSNKAQFLPVPFLFTCTYPSSGSKNREGGLFLRWPVGVRVPKATKVDLARVPTPFLYGGARRGRSRGVAGHE